MDKNNCDFFAGVPDSTLKEFCGYIEDNSKNHFICANEGASEQQFRQQCLRAFTDHKCLDFMFLQIKKIALTESWELPES